MNLCCEFTKSLIIVFTAFHIYFQNTPIRDAGSLLISNVIGNVMMLSCCAYTELATKKCKSIAMSLTKKLTTKLSKPERSEIKQFLLEIETCPIRFSICEMITLDSTLPLKYIGLLISYSIIVIGFLDLLEGKNV
ncbi:hypothetical protein EVAR_24928_1 [Eumeta japonica]|uniref:Uncharacterized protein n=1 Tax=Eumeta variegata TaxID=151549 RepID=A0A4C1V7M4_EUMVA|nr:hypothetical protein EVAR_24928_1 [Eumeta japonica]